MINQAETTEPLPALRVIDHSFSGRADLGTGVSAALMRRVARGQLAPTARMHRTGPILAFGRLDKLRPGYAGAVRISRELGYEPIERLAGGRAAVFHEGTISFSMAMRSRGGASETHPRFVLMAGIIETALRSLGVEAHVGEVAGEYCPGDYSVNARRERKLAGIGQRVITGGAHIGGVIVVRGAGAIREVLEPVYEALELEWIPATTGSIADELDRGDDILAGDDPLIGETIGALRAALASGYELEEARLDDDTLELAAELRTDHAPAT